MSSHWKDAAGPAPAETRIDDTIYSRQLTWYTSTGEGVVDWKRTSHIFESLTERCPLMLQQWRHCFAQPAGPDLRAKLLHIVLVQVRPATIAARLHGWDAGLRQERRVIASDIIEGWVIGESSRRSIIAA